MDTKGIAKALAPLLAQQDAIVALRALLAEGAELDGMASRNEKRRAELEATAEEIATEARRLSAERVKASDAHKLAMQQAAEELAKAEREGEKAIARVTDRTREESSRIEARNAEAAAAITARTGALRAEQAALEARVESLRREVSRLIGMTKAA